MTVAEIHELGLAEVDRIETEMRLIVEELGFDNLTLQQFTDMIRFRLFVNLLLSKINFQHSSRLEMIQQIITTHLKLYWMGSEIFLRTESIPTFWSCSTPLQKQS